jgi:hypothetical protein
LSGSGASSTNEIDGNSVMDQDTGSEFLIQEFDGIITLPEEEKEQLRDMP